MISLAWAGHDWRRRPVPQHVGLVLTLLAVQVADLLTFLSFQGIVGTMGPVGEVGVIAQVYAALGGLGTVAFKVAGIAVSLALAAVAERTQPRYVLLIAGAVVIEGAVGAAFNVYAILQLSALW